MKQIYIVFGLLLAAGQWYAVSTQQVAPDFRQRGRSTPVAVPGLLGQGSVAGQLALSQPYPEKRSTGLSEQVAVSDADQIKTFVGDVLEGVRFRTLRDTSQAWKTNAKYIFSEDKQPVMAGTEKFIDFVLPIEERSEEGLLLLDCLEHLLREYQCIGAISEKLFIACLHIIIKKYPGLTRYDIVHFWLAKASYLLASQDFMFALVRLFSKEIGKDFVNNVNALDFKERIENVTRFLGREGDLWQLPLFVNTRSLLGHTNYFVSAVFSPNEEKAVMAARNGTAWIWDIAGNLLQELTGHGLGVHLAVFSPDGKQVVTASSDGTAKIWDVATGTYVQTLTGHRRNVQSAVFSPDGSRVITASHDRTAKIWDVTTGTCVQTLTGHTAQVYFAGFSPDGKQVITASWDSTAKIWDVAAGTCAQTFTGHTDRVFSAVFSPDAKQAITASADRTAKIWNVATGICEKTLTGHTERVNSVVFSPDRKQVMTASDDGTAKLWDVATGTCVQTLKGHTARVYLVVFSADGKQVVTAAADRTAKIWDFGIQVSAAEKIMYDAFVASGLEQVVDEQITNPYSLQLLQKLNNRFARKNELIPLVGRYEDIPAYFAEMLQHMEQNASAQTNSF